MKFFAYPWATAGDKSAIPNNAQLDGSVSYTMGFTSNYQQVYGVDPNAKAVPRYAFNELMFDITTALRAWQTDAFPPFITSIMNNGSPYPYDQFAVVRFDDGSGMQVYWSKVANNTTLPTNITNWGVFSTDGWQPGDGKDYYGNQAPSTLGRWLACDGTIYNIATYPRLAAAIGNIWGGDGITTFAVPNLSRRATIGSGGTGSGIIGNTVGSVGGAETHVLTKAEMPRHNHPLSSVVLYNREANGSGTNYSHNTNHGQGSETIQLDITYEGNDQPHTLMQPSAVAQKLIRY